MYKNLESSEAIVDHSTEMDATQVPHQSNVRISTGQLLSPGPDELQLITRSQQGDGEAFAQLYDRYVDPIFRYIFFRVSDEYVAEDITAHVFIKMWEKLPDYQIGPTPVGAWLYRIARNAVIDHYRTSKVAVSWERVSPAEIRHDDAIEEKMDLQIRLEQLRKALENLTEGQREVLILRFIQGQTVHEIARELGKREGAVRALQLRALRELAKSPSLRKDGQVFD
ncbi:MAG TPA: sigma-70 family RNA polymerase sigma factor [Anaerolineales bacterium]